MPVTMLDGPELMVKEWRGNADEANPAGPLYLAGDFAEADIAGADNWANTGPSLCTGSHTIFCCA